MRKILRKTLTLIAPDGKKADGVAFALSTHQRLIAQHLVATIEGLFEDTCGQMVNPEHST